MSTQIVLETQVAALQHRVAELEAQLAAHGAQKAELEHHRLAAEYAADVIWLFDVTSGRFLYVSPSVQKLRGYTPDEVCAQSISDVLAPGSLAMINDNLPGRIAAFLAGESNAVSKTDEVEQTCKDGGTVWTEVTTTLLRQPDGSLRMLGVTRDISERRKVEDVLRTSDARYRVIFEGTDEGIIAYNLGDRRFEYVNPAMCALFGYTYEEFLRLDVPDLHPRDAIDFVMKEFVALTSGERTLASNVPCQKRNGTRFYADIKARASVLGDTALTVAFFRDVSERHRRDALLRARLHLSTLPPDCTLEDLLQVTLDEAEVVTESKIGYFHFLDGERKIVQLQHWSSNTLGHSCVLQGKGHTCNIEEAGIWAEAARQGVGKIYNDYASIPHRTELPEGHSPLTRMISAPVVRDGKVVALIGVGDKPTDYDEEDLEAITLLATEAWDLVLRNRAEAALRESEDRYRALVESQEAVITAIDGNGVHHFINRIGAALLKRVPEEIVGKSLHELFPLQEADGLLANVRRVIDTGHGLAEEAPNTWDGQVRWNRTSLQPLRNADGQVALVLVSSVDITERKEIELLLEQRVATRTAELQAIRQRLELATSKAGIGIWEWNCKTDALLWDDQMYKVFGVGQADFDGSIQGWERRVHPSDLPMQRALLQAALANERDFDSAYRILWPDGSEHYIKANAITLFDEQGLPDRMIGVNYDITLTKQAEGMLRQSEETLRRANLELQRAVRMKDDFLASMSHELRTPLTGILGMSEVLQQSNYGTLSERQRKAVVNIENSGRHLLDLINDILDISKIEADKLELQLEPASLNDICHASLQLVKGMAQMKRQNIRLTMDSTGVSIRCDARRVKQILVNLLSNAVKFTPEGGAIGLDVEGDAEAGIIRMTVWDNGIGIAAEDLPRLFQPFVQLDSSMSRQQSGTGLGLALVSRLTALHGGSVTVESTPDAGSRFIVALPWRPVEDAPRAPQRPDLTGQRILTIEDNEVDADRLTSFLRINGIENSVESQGRNAIARTLALQPAVILLDINLPDVSGWEVLAQLKTDPRTSVIPVVITSVEEDRQRAAALGAAGYLVKPIALTELRAELERAEAKTAPPSEPGPLTASDALGPVVMVVDDNQTNIDTMSEFLDARQYKVATARSGWEFLERVTEVRPELVLMDVQMPGMDGLEAIRRVRRHADTALSMVPIIALTALAMPGDRERCLAAGADEYVSKPMRLTELLALIDRLIREHHANG